MPANEVQRLLEGCRCGTLTRDEVESVLRSEFGFVPEQDDRDCDLVGVLVDLLRG